MDTDSKIPEIKTLTLVAYAFRTFPKINLLKKEFPCLFIFGKLKQDVESFCDHLLKVRSDFIIGLATTKTKSVFEPTAINNIHGHKVIANAPEKLSLHVPENQIFPVSPKPSNSFCNYSMFKIQSFINQQQLSSKLIFVHLNPKDISILPKIIK